MGFTTGLLSGATLTYSLLYLTLHIHRTNRQRQHAILSQSSTVLNSFTEPAILQPLPEPPAYEFRKTGIVETMKDRWNREIVGMVARVETMDWNRARHDAEVVLREGWVGVVDYTQEQGVGQAVVEKGKEVVEKGKDVLETVKEKVGVVAEDVREKVGGVAEEVKDKVKGGVDAARNRGAVVNGSSDPLAGKRLLDLDGVDSAKTRGVIGSGSSDPLAGKRLLDLK